MTTKLRPGDYIGWLEGGLRSVDYVDHVTEHSVVTKGGAIFDHAFADTQVALMDVSVVDPAPRDDVYHPPHYARWKMEPIEFIAINDLPWWLANVIKYTMRFDAKDGLQDLRKARSYLDMKIREVEGTPRFWDKPVTEERRDNGHA
jgi:hypothetical protein